MTYPKMPILQETDNEILLFIHPRFKERAKVISGYKWDRLRRCWVYPRTKEISEALKIEFSEGFSSVTELEADGRQPSTQKSASIKFDGKIKQAEIIIDQIYADNNEKDLGRHRIDLLASENKLLQANINILKSEVQSYEEKLKESYFISQENLRLKQLLAEREIELKNAQIAKDRLQINVDQLRADFQQKFRNIEKELIPVRNGSTLIKQLKKLAIEASGEDTKFTNQIKALDINKDFTLKIHKALEIELRQILGSDNTNKKDNMSDLLRKVKEMKLLSDEAIELAYWIKNQRNVVAHVDGDEKTYKARAVLCLMTASMIWPELKRKS